MESRRANINSTSTAGDILDDTPLEIPAGHRRLPSVAEEIQKQIAIQIAIKQNQEGGTLQTIDQIEAELLDLDDDETASPFFSQFEYENMREAIYGIDDIQTEEPTEGGVQNETRDNGENPDSQEENPDNG